MVIITAGREQLKNQIISNLIQAHKKMAQNFEPSNTKELIKLSKYILKISKNCEDILIQPITENNSDRSSKPPNNLQ